MDNSNLVARGTRGIDFLEAGFLAPQVTVKQELCTPREIRVLPKRRRLAGARSAGSEHHNARLTRDWMA